MHIDIVITTHSRAALLRNCLDSIESNFINGLSIQVLIVINGSDAETEGLLSKLNYQNIKIDYQTTAKKLNGAARNLALKKISGDWVLFIDDDATLPANYFKDFLQIVNQEPEIDILGGSDSSNISSNFHQRLMNALYSSTAAMGPTSRRHDPRVKDKLIRASEVDLTLCHLWVKRDFFKKTGLRFPSFLSKNEENYFLNEALKENAQMFFTYALKVNHLRKKSIPQVLSSISHSGYCRFEMNMAQKNKRNLIYFIPLLSLVTIVFLPISKLSISLFLLYLLFISFYSIVAALRFNIPFATGVLILLHPAVHLSYALGMLRASLSQLKRSSKGLKTQA